MDNYQQYNLCCAISLCSSESILIKSGRLIDLVNGVGDIFVKEHRPRFTFNEITGEIFELEEEDYDNKPVEVGIDSFTVYHLVQTLYQIYQHRRFQDYRTTSDDRAFQAISNYFRSCLNRVCNMHRVSFEMMNLIIIMPDKWAAEKDIEQLVIVPLLEMAGVVFSESDFAKLSCITFSEAMLTRKDVSRDTKNTTLCKVHNLLFESNTSRILSSYCQFESNTELKSTNLPAYIPRLTHSGTYKFIDVDALQKQIIQKTLKAGKLIQTPIKGDNNYNYKTVADHITHDILRNIYIYLRKNKCFAGIYNDHFLRKYLNESQRRKVNTSAFLKDVTRKVTAQLSEIIDFLDAQHSSVISRKTIFIVENLEATKNWFCDGISKILHILLRERRNGCFFKTNILNDDITTCGLLVAASYATQLNMSLLPVITTQYNSPDNDPPENGPSGSLAPKVVIFIDLTIEKTYITCNVISTFKKAERHAISMHDLAREKKFNPLFYPYFSAPKYVDAPRAQSISLKSQFIGHIKEVIDSIDYKLKSTYGFSTSAKYILRSERRITEYFKIYTKEEFQKLTPRIESLPAVADKGEMMTFNKIERNMLPPTSYYVHAHLSDDCIYLRLHQTLDTTPSPASVFIEDKMIHMRNMYDQVCDLLWDHFDSINGTEMEDPGDMLNDYLAFNRELPQFIDKILCQPFKNRRLDEKDTLRISEGRSFYMHKSYLMDVAILPVLKQLVVSVTSTLENREMFGRYKIDSLYITGSFFKSKEYDGKYGSMMISEMEKAFKQLFKQKLYTIKLDISLETHDHRYRTPEIFYNTPEGKAVSDDFLFKRELGMISSKTLYFQLKDETKQAVINKGDMLIDKRFELNYQQIMRLAESQSILFAEDIGDNKLVGTFRLAIPGTVTKNSFIAIQIKVSHLDSAIRVTIENDSATESSSTEYILLERKTLKYF